MSEDTPIDFETVLDNMFKDLDRDAPATKGDIWDKGREIRALKFEIEKDLKERSRWIRYNTKLAEGAWSMASSATIIIWGGSAFALARSEGLSSFWCWSAAMAAGGYSWYSAETFRPARPAD